MAFRVPPSRTARDRAGAGLTGLVTGTVALSAVAVMAAPVSAPEGAQERGAPIAQQFLDTHGDNVSLLATASGVSCVASRPIAIRESRYLAADGTEVPFDEIVRSPASSVQALARPDVSIAFRIQLKYTPASERPIQLRIGAMELDLTAMIEPSRDSLWLTGSVAESLAEAFARDASPTLSGTSAETGREVIDRIDPPAMAGLDACLDTLGNLEAMVADEAARTTDPPPEAAAEAEGVNDAFAEPVLSLVEKDEAAEPTLPVPVAGVRLEFRASPDPATRLSDEQLQHCRMRDIPDELFFGRLRAVTGFFAHTQDVYVAFDAEGRVQRAYVPGIFDGDLTAGVNSARVSLAADSNLPDQPNTVRGCLGDAVLAAPVCVYPGEAEDTHVIAECGVLGVSDERDLPFAPYAGGTPPAAPQGGGTFLPPLRLASFPPGGSPLLPPGGGTGTRPPTDDPDGDPPGTPDLPPIPLPAAIWLLLGALASLPGLRALTRRAARA